MSSQNISAFNFYNSTESFSSISREQVYVSFGQGLIVGGGFGYLFNQYVGAELSASWLKGHRYTARKIDPDKSTDMALSSQMVRLNPAIVILAGFNKINPYAKFGLIAGSGQFFSNRLN